MLASLLRVVLRNGGPGGCKSHDNSSTSSFPFEWRQCGCGVGVAENDGIHQLGVPLPAGGWSRMLQGHDMTWVGLQVLLA
jgi:hypothetical protein